MGVSKWGPARSHIFRISGSAVFRVALRIGGKSEGPIDGLIQIRAEISEARRPLSEQG